MCLWFTEASCYRICFPCCTAWNGVFPTNGEEIGVKNQHDMVWWHPASHCCLRGRKVTHYFSFFFFYPFFLHSVLITSWMLFQFSILGYFISNEDLRKMQNTVILTESCGILSGWLQINMHFWLHKHTASKKPFLCPHLWRGTNSCTPTASKSQLMGGEQTNQPTNPPTHAKKGHLCYNPERSALSFKVSIRMK